MTRFVSFRLVAAAVLLIAIGCILVFEVLRKGEVSVIPFRFGGQGAQEIFVHAHVNGKPVEIEIDTGTDGLLLDSNLSQRKEPLTNPREQADVEIGDWRRTVSVGGEYSRGEIDPSGLIGTLFLDGARMSIDVKKRILTVDRRNNRPPYTPTQPSVSINVRRLGGRMPGLNAQLTLDGRESVFFCIDTGSRLILLPEELYKP